MSEQENQEAGTEVEEEEEEAEREGSQANDESDDEGTSRHIKAISRSQRLRTSANKAVTQKTYVASSRSGSSDIGSKMSTKSG